MNVIVDTREQELLKRLQSTIDSNLKYKGITLVTENLPIGDIIINDGEKDCVIIERKTLSDLSASIKDGRYDEQSYRLSGLDHPNHNIIYLIEGDLTRLNPFKDRFDKQTLYSAMFSINYFKGFSLMRSMNMDETANIICNMTYKLVKDQKLGKKPYYTNSNANAAIANINATNANATNANETTPDLNAEETNKESENKASEKDYCAVIKKVKKENITPENIGEIMLCQIPGVSSATALAILSQYKTMPNLIKCIQDDSSCLNNVCTVDSNGKSRKISKTAIATIVQYLSK